MSERMHLVGLACTGPTVYHSGGWRHPETDNNLLAPEWYEHAARVMEAGKFDAIFLADTLAFYGRVGVDNVYDTLLEKGGPLYMLDPLPLAAIMARATSRLGIGVTVSSTFFTPYQIARVMGTLNHISDGRIAWNVVTSVGRAEAQNFGLDDIPPRDERYDRADEVVEAAVQLWDSWPADAIVADKERGYYADPAKVRPIDYKGRWTKTAGPLTTPISRHGRPVIMQAGASGRGREFAARWAEIIFTVQHAKPGMQAFYSDVKARMVAAGRHPDDCAILTAIQPIVGETESIARDKQEYVNAFVDVELGLFVASHSIGVDLIRFPRDKPLEALAKDEGGSHGIFDVIIQATKAENLTLTELARNYVTSHTAPQVVGTAESVADQLQDYFEAKGCDGFMITPTEMPGTFESFTRSVVPILQKRGLFRRDYGGATLRGHLRD